MLRKFAAPAILVLFGSCSSGPPPVRTGTPAYYWSLAVENYESADLTKTLEQVEKVFRSENEFVGRARVLRLVTLAGLVDGYRELANTWEYGARAVKSGSPMPFRRRTGEYRALATSLALQLGEAYKEFAKAQPDGPVVFHFRAPKRGTTAMPQGAAQIGEGRLIPDADSETLFTAMLQRSALLKLAHATGAGEDGPAARKALEKPPVEVPRKKFEAAMAQALYDASTIFGPKGRGETPRQQFLLEQVSLALSAAGGDAPKDLKTKLEKDLKDIKARSKG